MGVTGFGKRVQYGISSHGGVEMLVTNGRIAEFAVEVQPDPVEKEWREKSGPPDPVGIVFPRYDYFDTSLFQRIQDEKPVGEVVSATDRDGLGVTRGIQMEVRNRLCPRCRCPSYVTLYFYSLSEDDKNAYRKQTLCLACLEKFLAPEHTNG